MVRVSFKKDLGVDGSRWLRLPKGGQSSGMAVAGKIELNVDSGRFSKEETTNVGGEKSGSNDSIADAVQARREKATNDDTLNLKEKRGWSQLIRWKELLLWTVKETS
ncbi:hypothetical protein PTKIN_Ptkin17bG0047800 [Pterospermum kingtungense]